MSPVIFSAIFPHPPIIVPFIGGKELKKAEATQKALQKSAKKIQSLNSLDAVIIITPHNEVGQAGFPVFCSHVFEGDFNNFNHPLPRFSFKGDFETASAIIKAAEAKQINAYAAADNLLDHGALVPLYYLHSAGFKKPIVPIGICFQNLKNLYSFGQAIFQAAAQKNKKIAVIASADMSHALSPSSPSGFQARAKEFDEKLAALVKAHEVEAILNFDPQLADLAHQDALWSIAIMLGAIADTSLKPEVLSYEAPFGVGYMVAIYE